VDDENRLFLFPEGFQDPSEITMLRLAMVCGSGSKGKPPGEVALVAVLAQCFQDGCKSRLPEPRSLSVGVVDVNMAEMNPTADTEEGNQ